MLRGDVLPYLQPPAIGTLVLPWFALLVGLAVFVGIRLTRWRAPHFPIDAGKLDSLLPIMLLSSFVCSHLVHVLAYAPRETLARPWEILAIWRGHSSIGGFAGTLVGAVVWRRVCAPGTQLMPLADLVMSVFPISWTIGRMGCALVHDHVGKLAASPNPLTVAFPDGPRYDLGLLEMFAAMVIAAVAVSLWREPRRIGTYAGLGMVLYAPVRFGLDFLRVDAAPGADARHAGLTAGQWGSLALLGFGLWILARRPPLSPRPTSRQPG